MTLTSKCPSCGHTHIVRPAIGQGAHGAGVIVLEHEQLALHYEESLRENDVLANASATDRSIITAQQEEIVRLRREYAEEVAEYNAGFAAREAGQSINDEPSALRHDAWRGGWIVADYDITHRAPKETTDAMAR